MTLEDHGIRIRSHRLGNHKTICPQCSHTRKHKNDPCLSVTIEETGFVYNCHNCDFKGGSGGDSPKQAFKSGAARKPWVAEFKERYKW